MSAPLGERRPSPLTRDETWRSPGVTRFVSATGHDDAITAEIARIVGVYDADGTVVGELAYFVRARLGRGHCALCDITHGRVRERRDWRECRDRLPAPVVTFHRNDQPAQVRSAEYPLPVVLAETDAGEFVVLVDRDEIERCAGSPEGLTEAIRTAVAAQDLRWPDTAE